MSHLKDSGSTAHLEHGDGTPLLRHQPGDEKPVVHHNKLLSRKHYFASSAFVSFTDGVGSSWSVVSFGEWVLVHSNHIEVASLAIFSGLVQPISIEDIFIFDMILAYYATDPCNIFIAVSNQTLYLSGNRFSHGGGTEGINLHTNDNHTIPFSTCFPHRNIVKLTHRQIDYVLIQKWAASRFFDMDKYCDSDQYLIRTISVPYS